MDNTLDFANKIGRRRLALAFGVGATAVSNAIRRGQFPASWYEIGQSLAAEAGVNCPPELFGQKIPHTQKGVCDNANIQGAADK